MNISIEQIDEMRKRTNCSYQEARELLEKHDGDLINAIIEFERKNGHDFKANPSSNSSEKKSRVGKTFKELLHKGIITRFIIEKEGTTILNIPVLLLLFVILITMPAFAIYIIAFIVIYLLGYKIRIRKEEGKEVDINEIVDGIGSKVRTAADKMRENPAAKDQNTKQGEAVNINKQKEDDYNEITVE